MDELIKSLTPQQIEAAYRHQEMLYRINDAEAHLFEAAGIQDWDDTIALAQFEEEYNIPFSRLIDPEDELYALEIIAEQFINKYDCNCSENDMFEFICEEYLANVHSQFRYKKPEKKIYRVMFSHIGFADVEAVSKTEAEGLAKNLRGSQIAWRDGWEITDCEEYNN